MERGAVGFATNRHSQVSKLIRWFSQSPWSHSFIILDVVPDDKYPLDRTYLLEANEFGTEVRSFYEYRDHQTIPTELWRVKADPEKISAALAATQRKFEGMFYGYLELLGIAFKILAARFLHWKTYDPIKQGAICSQVAWFYLHELFPEEFGHLDQYSVSPAELRAIVSKSPNFEVL